MVNPILLDAFNKARPFNLRDLAMSSPVTALGVRKGGRYCMQGSLIASKLRELPLEDAIHLKIEGVCLKDGELLLTSVNFQSDILDPQMSVEYYDGQRLIGSARTSVNS
jgi:hypothetical protein